MKIKVEVFGGPMDGKNYVFKKLPVTLGRNESNGGVLSLDDYISAYHCVLFQEDDRIYIADMKSTNGTFVNDNRISEAVILNDGDQIMIGRTIVKFSKLQNP